MCIRDSSYSYSNSLRHISTQIIQKQMIHVHWSIQQNHQWDATNILSFSYRYRILMWSILDYDSPVYGLAHPSQLKLLKTIQNAGLRIATGAFHTSPLKGGCSYRSQPLHYRKTFHTAKLLVSIAHNNPAPPAPRDKSSSHLQLNLEKARSHTCHPHLGRSTSPLPRPI